jgi:PAT family beta-lactamase induction signal transducer AmpG
MTGLRRRRRFDRNTLRCTQVSRVQRNWLAVFRSRRMAVLFFLGFSSGLPLMLTGQTLTTWMTEAKVDVRSIAKFSLVGLAYTWKFAWAPLLDRYALPLLGRRRGWILVFQLGLIVALLGMSTVDPAQDLKALAIMAAIVATLSASQDTMIDAYNTDLLAPEERAAGSATYVMGYRLAMLVAGSLALILADHVEWRVVYCGMAAAMSIGIVASFLAEEPPLRERPPRTIASAVVLPFQELFRRLGWRQAALVLAFAATYKFGEQFAQVLSPVFFRDVIQFTKTDIGVLQKAVGFAAWAVGGVVGGTLTARYGVKRTIVAYGIVQAMTHLGYLWVAYVGKDLVAYGVATFIENLSFAMATTALVAALMAVCAPAVSATQFALLTSLTSVGQRVFGTLAGDVVEAVGWKGFFLTTIALAIPGLVLAWLATRKYPDPPPR